ncbi:MAG TPA: molybdenum cofactor guanylyltransferase [Candidatus Polarisedimenticolia bacterium]|nr:molybdenum cofactor guanylyltransferase [Candidatus Polarisedimenticolia bacterium]
MSQIASTAFTGLVLAGGRSTRMGRDKASLPIAGRTLLLRAVETIRRAGGTPVVLGPPRPESESHGARFLDDPGEGPLQALRVGMSGTPGPWFALACDLPLLKAEAIGALVAGLEDHDAVVPRALGRLQVLAAAYAPPALAAFERAIATGECAMQAAVAGMRVRVVDPDALREWGDETMFLNVNTPDDLRDAADRLAAGHPERAA